MGILIFIALAILFTLSSLPQIGYAQTGSDLRSTIRAELLSDPRTSGLSRAQLDAMVDVLTEEAERRGLSAQDLQWHPTLSDSFTATSGATPDACGGTPSFLCAFGTAFGFLGDDVTIPFWLEISSMALIWLIASMIEHRRMQVPRL